MDAYTRYWIIGLGIVVAIAVGLVGVYIMALKELQP